MFSLARALSSPASAEDKSSLFDRFTGTTARSDSSGACPSAVRLFAFSDWSRSWLEREAPEVSRFSCMLFLSVRGFLDYAEPANYSRSNAIRRIAFSVGDGIGASEGILFEAQSPGPPMPLSTLQRRSRDLPRKTQGQDGFACSFPVGLFHPLQHAGCSETTTREPSNPCRDLALRGP